MFENRTFENILAEMLAAITSDVDKREGSIIYDALAPAAYKFAEFYFELNNYTDLLFIDTAVSIGLDRHAGNLGDSRKPATKALRKVETQAPVEMGTRWGIDETTYVIKELIAVNVYSAECEQYGEVGNISSGELSSFSNVGIQANLTEVLIYGEELESDESLRKRLKDKMSNSAKDGNIAQYQQWVSEYSGIGKSKIFPLWNGGNTVKISITSASNNPASESLIEAFQQYIDPNSSGLGEGKAPLGAKVTVTTGTPKTINIAAEIVLEEGYSDAAEASAKIVEYLRTITYRQSYVSYFYVGNILVGLDSIYDIRNLTLNGLTADIALGVEEIPTLGSLNLTVVS